MTRQDIALAIERLREAGAPPLLIDALRAWHTEKIRREAVAAGNHGRAEGMG